VDVILHQDLASTQLVPHTFAVVLTGVQWQLPVTAAAHSSNSSSSLLLFLV
jgi:hypothetical protein